MRKKETAKPPKRSSKKVFIMHIATLYEIRGAGNMITRRVGQGSSATGTKVRFFFLGMHHKSVAETLCENNVGITNVTILSKGNMPHSGEVMQCCSYDVLVMVVYLELIGMNGL